MLDNEPIRSNSSSASSSTTALPYINQGSRTAFPDDKNNGQAESGKTTNRLATSANVLKTIVGAGIFSTPFALQQSGFGFGLILIVIMGVIFYW